MRKALGIITGLLLTSCAASKETIVRGPSPGIEYRNQSTAPWPWISVVPSARALAVKDVDFDVISRQLHFDMSFDPHSNAFKNVRLVVIDYTVLPATKNPNRPDRYFMTASFYKIGRKPPCPADFEVTTSIRKDKAGKEEAMRYMARDIIEEIYTLSDEDLLTPGRKITVNLD